MPPIDCDSVAALYDAYVTADLDVAFFSDEARRAGGPVLELMSGTGRLSIPLMEAGAELTCVDRSRGMLDVLSKKLAARDAQPGGAAGAGSTARLARSGIVRVSTLALHNELRPVTRAVLSGECGRKISRFLA